MALGFSSLAFDWLVRKRLGGTHLNLFVVEECTISENFKKCDLLVVQALSLLFPYKIGASAWSKFYDKVNLNQSWRRSWAVSNYERLRRRALVEAVSFKLFDLDHQHVKIILNEVDYPTSVLRDKYFANNLDSRGFWRIDKDIDPEVRHTVLSLIAFHDLQEKGLDAFLNQNDGEGWMIPEVLRLADYGLGHDDRAQEYQPVASRLGPRFYDWQLNEDVKRSWEECEAHAELIRKIVPIQAPDDEGIAEVPTSPTAPSSQQMNLF
ncbi:MAG: hypothetical protein EG822_18865 [Deltaproteobacteria bacterium]|nr:hypothetical protein [Deltaproteobacteria bacterium]TLN00405.1 MAG: hypothetical protein FDZ73_19575 [bacterium]